MFVAQYRHNNYSLNIHSVYCCNSLTAASARADIGVSSDGFNTAEQPAASAGPTFLVTMAMGKFHGVISAATPTGCLSTSTRRPATVGGMMLPFTLLASSENHSKKEAPYLTSANDSLNGFPYREGRED